MLGQIIGSYRIVAELGQGGMGVVYKAEHVQLGRQVAIKMLLPQMSADRTIVQRFFNEARAASAIDHPGIVEVYDFGTHTDGSAYLVMELLKGESLDHRLMSGMPPLEAASILAQAAGALAAAHARGIVHRDLKPDNIYLVPNELLPGGIQVKLLDFGIAKLADERAAGFKTQTGVLIGTPAYMSPEQCMGRPDIDHRSDLYSLGCILFHMLSGRPPFWSDHGTGVMIAMHLRDPVPDLRALAPHVPPPLVAITLRLLEKEPAARFQSAQELRAALVAAGAVAPVTRPDGAAGGRGSSGPDAYGATVATPTGPGAQSQLGSMPGAAYRGGEAYGATAALTGPAHGAAYPVTSGGIGMTTSSGSAGEMVTKREGPPRAGERGQPAAGRTAGSKRGAWLAVGGLLVAVGGVGVAVAVSGGGGGGSGSSGSSGGSGSSQASSLIADPAKPDPAKPDPAKPDPAKPDLAKPNPNPTQPAPDCPSGQLRSDDTQGHCCWPGQAWSTPKDRCVGVPACPSGMRARLERCVEVAEVDPSLRPPPPPPRDGRVVDPRLQLAASSYPPGAAIEIQLAAPISAPSGHRAWIAVSEAGSPPSSYGAWAYVNDGAQRASLTAPAKPGAYEIRLYTDYPAKSYQIARTARFRVAPLAESPDPARPDPARPDPTPPDPAPAGATPLALQRFSLASTTVRPGDQAVLRFPSPMIALPKEQFWVTVIEPGAPDSRWGPYEYVKAGARTLTIKVPTAPGDYEIRLHANYPTKTTHLVHRAAIRVE